MITKRKKCLMDLDQFPLGMFEADCDGSACGSDVGLHVHGPQYGSPAICRVVVRDNQRVCYEELASA
jgi:hypothetical protein